MTDLSVVIPTYNRLETLRWVIPSLFASDLEAHRYEVIVADSQSDDGTTEYLAEMAALHPHLRHVPGPYSGRAAARNAGIAVAQGTLVLFTDADIIAEPGLLRRHLQAHAASAARGHRRVAVVGMELQVDSIETYERLRDEPYRRRPLHPSRRRRLDWLYFLTGNASVRREDLVELGGFDEHFTGYGHEDLELGFRLIRQGISILYEPGAVNYHWHPVPYDEQRQRMELAGRSTIRFLQKHRSFEAQVKLGATAPSLMLYRVLHRLPRLRRWLERRGERTGLARTLIYQYAYQCGIVAALAERSHSS